MPRTALEAETARLSDILGAEVKPAVTDPPADRTEGARPRARDIVIAALAAVVVGVAALGIAMGLPGLQPPPTACAERRDADAAAALRVLGRSRLVHDRRPR